MYKILSQIFTQGYIQVFPLNYDTRETPIYSRD